MSGRAILPILVCSAVCILAAYSVLRDSAIDQAAGLPVSDLIKDVRSTASVYKKEQHEVRVEELNSEYE